MPRHSLHYYSDIANEVRNVSARLHSPKEARAVLSRFGDDHMQLGMPPNTEQCWHRVSKLQDPEEFQNLHRLIYRPHPATEYQRSTLIGAKVFYASANRRIALDEIEASAGDIVGLITTRQHGAGKTPLWIIGEFDSILNAGYSLLGAGKNESDVLALTEQDPVLSNHFHFMDAVFSQIFRRSIQDSRDYLMTAVISDYCFSRNIGICFPSVRTHRGMNAAFSDRMFDVNFEVVSASILRVVESYGSGVYELSLIKTSCDFSVNGEINWGGSRELPSRWSLQTGIIVPSEYVGWRIPVGA